jgi:recombinational DNA repair protein (RecF pathway)
MKNSAKSSPHEEPDRVKSSQEAFDDSEEYDERTLASIAEQMHCLAQTGFKFDLKKNATTSQTPKQPKRKMPKSLREDLGCSKEEYKLVLTDLEEQMRLLAQAGWKIDLKTNTITRPPTPKRQRKRSASSSTKLE